MQNRLCFLIILLIICLNFCGCARSEEQKTPTSVEKIKKCGLYEFEYNTNLYEVISGENSNQKLLTFADKVSNKAEGISAMVIADYSLLNGNLFPTNLREAKMYLMDLSTASKDVRYAETDKYYIETANDYATDGNYAYYTIFAVPKNSANDSAIYSLKFVYGKTFFPSDGLFDACLKSFSDVIGRELIIDYKDTMKELKKQYDEVNGNGEIDYNYNEDDEQDYKPRLKNGEYLLNGSDFNYIDIGDDDNNVKPGIYVLHYVSGNGTFNQTDNMLMPQNTYEMNSKFKDVEIVLKKGDRLFIGKSLCIKFIYKED